MIIRRKIEAIIASVIFTGILLQQPVLAQEISNEVMRDITNTVRSLCNSPDREGDDFSIEGQVGGGTLIRMLGVKGEVSLSSSQWQGIKDALSDRKNLRDCVRDLTPLFLDNFRPNKGSGIDDSQLGNICRANQDFELCLDSWTARGSTASVGLTLWNTTGRDVRVCMFGRYAYAISQSGEISQLRSNRFCWDLNADNVKKLSYLFEFKKGPVGKSFDFSIEFEQPYVQFVFNDITPR